MAAQIGAYHKFHHLESNQHCFLFKSKYSGARKLDFLGTTLEAAVRGSLALPTESEGGL
jgi:hypothetical protein